MAIKMFNDAADLTINDLIEIENDLNRTRNVENYEMISNLLSKFDKYVPTSMEENYQRTKQKVILNLVRDLYNENQMEGSLTR